MHETIHHDPRLRAVPWRDLVALRPGQVAGELVISLPWLLASWAAAHTGWWVVAVVCSFFFFLTGLRQVHNAFHHALGVSRRATDWIMVVLSVTMLGAMHAVRFNHLQHHKHCLGDRDLEGRSAQMSAWGALAFGPLFPILLHWHALRDGGPRTVRWVWLELAANLVWVTAAFSITEAAFLRYHVVAMAVGQCLTAFFAVWTVHHHCDRTHFIARTLRHRVKNFLTYNMFLHIEHHLFPRVPTCHWNELSKRIDAAAPELKRNIVF